MPNVAGLALRKRTRLTYTTHHRNYLRYCEAIGHDPFMALDEIGLCGLMIHYVRTHKLTTLASFMSGVSNWYAQHSLGALPRNKQYTDVKQGLGNVFGLSEANDPKTAFTFRDIVTLIRAIDTTTFDGARDALLYLLSFFGLLRRSECGPRLTMAHVTRADWGLALTIPYSKTNLRPVVIRVCARHDEVCPLAAYDRYVSLIPSRLRLPSFPLFRACSDRNLPHDLELANSALLRRVADVLCKGQAQHPQPRTYGWHSFRRGGTTLMFIAGVPESLIAAHGRWSSLTYRRYFDNSVHQLLPIQRVMRYTQGHGPSVTGARPQVQQGATGHLPHTHTASRTMPPHTRPHTPYTSRQ